MDYTMREEFIQEQNHGEDPGYIQAIWDMSDWIVQGPEWDDLTADIRDNSRKANKNTKIAINKLRAANLRAGFALERLEGKLDAR